MSVHPLVSALARVPGTVAELEAATPRLTLTANYGERTSSGSKTAPAPVNLAALDAKHAIHTWLIDKAIQIGASFPRGIVDLTRHLTRNLDTITANGWADAWARELREHLDQAERVNHPNEPRKHLGPCPTVGCETPLSSREGDHETRCPTCGQTYNIQQHQQWRIMEALGHDGTPVRAAEAVRILRANGVDVTTKDVENWVKWGMQPAGSDHKGRKLFNLTTIYDRARKKTA